ncbi:MAG: hypothetical protein IPJ17_07035 [Holophagales bacterium]|nr:MAG: hypothetical protein IPJ17_07035 [Holophagales bacterium]
MEVLQQLLKSTPTLLIVLGAVAILLALALLLLSVLGRVQAKAITVELTVAQRLLLGVLGLALATGGLGIWPVEATGSPATGGGTTDVPLEVVERDYIPRRTVDSSYVKKELVDQQYLRRDAVDASYLSREAVAAQYLKRQEVDRLYIRRDSVAIPFLDWGMSFPEPNIIECKANGRSVGSRIDCRSYGSCNNETYNRNACIAAFCREAIVQELAIPTGQP